jgi:hypothetical protein
MAAMELALTLHGVLTHGSAECALSLVVVHVLGSLLVP